MNIIIIEDEKPAARLLQRKVEQLGFKITKMLHSVEESIAWFSANSHPDLLFLDIQLSDGLSFEIFEKIKIESAIIFTTAYDEYALRAFKLNSIDYLLKPIDEDELKVAIEKFQLQLSRKEPLSLNFEQIRSMFAPTEKVYKTRFTVKIGLQFKIITIDEIECFLSENKGTYIHTYENRNYLIDTPLEILEDELNPKNWFRISRKFLVPIASVKEIVVYSNSRLKIILPTYREEEVIVSREKVVEFKNWMA